MSEYVKVNKNWLLDRLDAIVNTVRDEHGSAFEVINRLRHLADEIDRDFREFQKKDKHLITEKVVKKVRSALQCENPDCNACFVQYETEIEYDWEKTLKCPHCGDGLVPSKGGRW